MCPRKSTHISPFWNKVMRVNLTAEKVESYAKAPDGKRIEVFDAAVPGLVLRITDKGVKTFVVRYRHKGRSQRYTIGKTPPIKLKEARATALQVLAASRQGDNPAASKRSEKVAAIDALVDQYIAKGFADKKPAYADEVARVLRRHVVAVWKSRDIATIETHHVAKLLDGIESISAKRHVQYALQGFFRWCRGYKYIEASPIDEHFPAPQAGKSRDRVLTRDELAAVWKVVSKTESAFHSIVKLLILTGQRRDEVGQAQWDEFDSKKRLWTIPAEMAKNWKETYVPLTPLALDVLKAVPRTGSPYLFPGTGAKLPVFSGYSKSKERLDKQCGVTDWRLHDLRRTMATRMAEAGVLPHIIERIHNRQRGEVSGVAAIYNRATYIKEMRTALEGWSKHVESLTAPQATTTWTPPPMSELAKLLPPDNKRAVTGKFPPMNLRAKGLAPGEVDPYAESDE